MDSSVESLIRDMGPLGISNARRWEDGQKRSKEGVCSE